MRIQLLTFQGCPLADAARAALEQALVQCRLSSYEEIDIFNPDTPEDLQGWGSPAILINEVDLTGVPKGDSVGCRMYQGPDKIPSVASIVAGVEAALK